MFHFDYDATGQLLAEEVPLQKIAAELGTPTYVYAEATLTRHFRVYDQAFSAHPHLVCYAVKANTSGALLSLFASMGGGADIVSGGELFRALRAGVPADRIVFSGVGKTAEEMQEALDAGILSFNVESEPELLLLDQVARARGVQAPVALRVNPNVDAKTHPYIATGLKESKFGVPITEGRRLAELVVRSPGLRLTGLDCHIGSQLTKLGPTLEALDSVLALADELRGAGHPLEHVDIGGGLGITYSGETPPHPDELGQAVTAKMKGRPELLILEPGRVIVGNAGILLSRVLYVKETKDRTFLVLDAAMNDLIRPSLYQAHHEIWPVERHPERGNFTVDVVGPICESGDTFAKARTLPRLLAGELVAILSAGAYGFSMASTYNSRRRAAEVLVSGDRFCAIRARETYESLVAGETLPPWQRGA